MAVSLLTLSSLWPSCKAKLYKLYKYNLVLGENISSVTYSPKSRRLRGTYVVGEKILVKRKRGFVIANNLPTVCSVVLMNLGGWELV